MIAIIVVSVVVLFFKLISGCCYVVAKVYKALYVMHKE